MLGKVPLSSRSDSSDKVYCACTIHRFGRPRIIARPNPINFCSPDLGLIQDSTNNWGQTYLFDRGISRISENKLRYSLHSTPFTVLVLNETRQQTAIPSTLHLRSEDPRRLFCFHFPQPIFSLLLSFHFRLSVGPIFDARGQSGSEITLNTSVEYARLAWIVPNGHLHLNP